MLLKDLCARLPYIPIIKIEEHDWNNLHIDAYDTPFKSYYLEPFIIGEIEIKPYLRPMSSMTEEEVKELIKIQILSKHGKEGGYFSLNNIKSIKNIRFHSVTNEWYCDVTFNTILDGDYTTCFGINRVTWETTIDEIDWLNKKGFDYRGLIPMGLALEAPEGMYK